MAVTNNRAGRWGLFFANPMMAKLDKVEETDDNSISIKGITSKTIFLLLLTIVGLGIYLIASKYIPVYMVESEGYSVNVIEGGIVLLLLLLASLGAFLSFKFVRAASVFGSFYSLVQGYSLAFIFEIFGKEMLYPAIAALLITILVVLVLLFLYKNNIIKVNHKFSAIFLTIVAAGILISVIYTILSFIPMFDSFNNAILNNAGIYILVSIISLIISTIFLLIDFEVLNSCIEKKLPKKYEWLSAFGLSFAIIEVYLRILDLLSAFSNKDN